VIGPSGAVRVMVATKPLDFRKGMEGLATLVRESMRADPFSGAVYVFRAKRADRIKLVFWDGTDLCLFAKRLEDGIFRWPKIKDGVMRLSAAQLSALLEGLDWRLVHEARETPNLHTCSKVSIVSFPNYQREITDNYLARMPPRSAPVEPTFVSYGGALRCALAGKKLKKLLKIRLCRCLIAGSAKRKINPALWCQNAAFRSDPEH